MAARALLERGEHPIANLRDRADTRDFPILRRARVALRGPIRIVVHERPRLLPVDLEPLPDRLFPVVVALNQRLAREVVLTRYLRRIEFDVVDAPRAGVYPAPAHPLNDLILRHVDLEHEVESDARFAHRFRLGNGARKAVEQVAVLAIQVLQPFLHQPDDDVVGNELPRVHDLLCRKTKRRARLYRGAQHVPRRDLRNAEVFPDEACLGALTSAGWSQEDQSHYCARRLRPGSYPTRRTYRL